MEDKDWRSSSPETALKPQQSVLLSFPSDSGLQHTAHSTPPFNTSMTYIQHRSGAWRARRLTTQQGFSLLESLIAILIFALGTLGLIGLQTTATVAQTETRSRSEAAALAQEMVALMWTDMGQLDQYVTYETNASDSCIASACQRWLNKVRTALPNGRASIARVTIQDRNSNMVGSQVALTVTWQPPNGDLRRYETATAIIRGTVQ